MRVGVIGMKRGDNHIKALVQIEGVEIRAICDKNPLQAEKAMAWFEGTDHRPEIYTDGEDEWKKLCERKDLDLIFICMDINLENGGGNTKILPPSEAGMKNDDQLARQWARAHELKG